MEDRRKPQESQQQLKELDSQHAPPSCRSPLSYSGSVSTLWITTKNRSAMSRRNLHRVF